MLHKGTIEIISNRIILRKFNEKDILPSFENWARDYKTTEFLNWKPHEDILKTEVIILDWINKYQNKLFYKWAIVPKLLNEPIGAISITQINDFTSSLRLDYFIGSKWWHQGYMTETLSIIVPYLFDEIKANRIEALYDTRNENAGKLLSKCGFLYEGTLRNADINNSGLSDVAIYAYLASDYYRKKDMPIWSIKNEKIYNKFSI